MNLGQIIDFVGNLLDYDPTNATYKEQLISLLNDSQTSILTDRPWPFSMRERSLIVWTDVEFEFTFTNGSATLAGVGIPHSNDPVMPGSEFEGAKLRVTDSGGITEGHTIAWVKDATTAYLERPFQGATGTYTVTLKRREIRLPSDSMRVETLTDPKVGTPAKALFLSKWERDDLRLDAEKLGTIDSYLPSEGIKVQAPITPRGVTVTSTAAGRGVRSITVYMVNVRHPFATNCPVYPVDVSDGFESALSRGVTYELNDTETLRFQPETLDPSTGLYRRYYFTCPEAGIDAPVRVRNDQVDGVALNEDTIDPDGGKQLKPDLKLVTLEGQPFQSKAIRYVHDQSAHYQSVELYPHPSATQRIRVTTLTNPRRMQQDSDAPRIPAAYAKIIGYAALEQLTLKVDNAALSAVYARKKDTLAKAMEQSYLKAPTRRVFKGTGDSRRVPNIFGPLKYTP